MRDAAWEFVIRHTTQDAPGHVLPMAAADISVVPSLARAGPLPIFRGPESPVYTPFTKIPYTGAALEPRLVLGAGSTTLTDTHTP